ncbi:WPP domain-interacting protein 1 [Sesamum alatum]|uniref:WPP domain-interacting protein 1 n=1 Tax=Sesamum alatum TaxID=300844 RepID=A0AAE1XZ80_9LAMI|nr:WPP domain-interacting protein 1 [Sesamum alatum]
MNLESGCSVLDSVKDSEGNRNGSVLEKLGGIDESEVQDNGSCEVETNDNKELLSDVKGKETEVSRAVSSPPEEMKSEVPPESVSSPHEVTKTEPSPSPTTRKGFGLKKWRRIRRDASKGGESSVDTGKMAMQELSNSAAHPSKRPQVYAERQQKTEDSVSSVTPMVGGLDIFALLGDSGLALGPSVDAGTDSENSEDRSSKSSTAASIPKIKYEIPMVMGFPHDKSRMRSLNVKNFTHSVQRSQQGKGRIDAIKKARGERVKLEKENSHSSVESDSRSSSFVFMQGKYATSNGIRSESPVHYDGENGDEVQGSDRQVSDGLRSGYTRDDEGGYEDTSPAHAVANSSWEVKKEKSDNHGSASDQDPLVESISALQAAQDALEKEVLKFKEIISDASGDDAVLDTHPGSKDVEFPSGEGVQSFPHGVQSEVVETANRDVETELEYLFMQKIEAEVEHLAISTMVQNLKLAAVDQITILKEQKALASEQSQILNKLGDTGNKAATHKKESEKLADFCEDVASDDETLRLRKKVRKYTSYFLVQLLTLLVIVGVFLLQLSPNYVEVVPT